MNYLYLWYIYILVNMYTKKSSFSLSCHPLLLVLIYHLLVILCYLLFDVYTDGYLYCIDIDHDLCELKKELSYWQEDLQGLQQLYKDKGYDVLNNHQLTQQQLADKASLEESIADGRRNVSNSIKDIGKLLREKNELSSTLGKRQGDAVSQPQDNKKPR